MNALSPEEIADGLNLNELPRTRSWHIQVGWGVGCGCGGGGGVGCGLSPPLLPHTTQGCSAKTGENLQDGMEWLVQMIGEGGKGAAAGGAEEKS